MVSQNGQDTCVPLKAVYVRGKLLDLVGEVVVMQEYKNETNDPLEARYIFPLDDKCAVVAFEAYINGKHIIGECKVCSSISFFFFCLPVCNLSCSLGKRTSPA